jgi:hypothetical protein
MTEQLFHVRRYKCPDGSFEWYVLNGHTARRVSKSFPTRAKAEAKAGQFADEARCGQGAVRDGVATLTAWAQVNENAAPES